MDYADQHWFKALDKDQQSKLLIVQNDFRKRLADEKWKILYFNPKLSGPIDTSYEKFEEDADKDKSDYYYFLPPYRGGTYPVAYRFKSTYQEQQQRIVVGIEAFEISDLSRGIANTGMFLDLSGKNSPEHQAAENKLIMEKFSKTVAAKLNRGLDATAIAIASVAGFTAFYPLMIILAETLELRFPQAVTISTLVAVVIGIVTYFSARELGVRDEVPE
jgi:hypothetical protein